MQFSLFEVDKRCSMCGYSKPISAFRIRKSRGTHFSYCAECDNAKRRKWTAANPDKVAASRRTYYVANQERIKARSKAYHHANLDERRRKARAGQIWRKYGITPEDYDQLLRSQDGRCAICGSSEPGMAHMVVPLVVDHNHDTNEIRGLLCVQCNAGLGQFADNPDRLVAAAMYLLRFADVLGPIGDGAK